MLCFLRAKLNILTPCNKNYHVICIRRQCYRGTLHYPWHRETSKVLSNALKVYEGASSARVNWGKSEALWAGQLYMGSAPRLPGGLQWDEDIVFL